MTRAVLSVLGELGVETHGTIRPSPDGNQQLKRAYDLEELTRTLGGCGFFAGMTALEFGTPTQLTVHAGSSWPYHGLSAPSSARLDELIARIDSVHAVTEGDSAEFFSFWKPAGLGRTLFCRSGRGLRAADLTAQTLDSRYVLLMTQGDASVYEAIRLAQQRTGAFVAAAPNRALFGKPELLREFLLWGDLLFIDSYEATASVLGTLSNDEMWLPRPRRATVIVTAEHQPTTVYRPGGGVYEVKPPARQDRSLLGAGDILATATLCRLIDGQSLPHAVRDAGLDAVSLQHRVTGDAP